MKPTTVATAIAFPLTVVLVASLSAPAMAQSYPERAIRMIVPFAAGGGVGVFGQQLIAELGPKLSQDVVLEYIPGSGGMIGAAAVAQAEPDGYTLLLSTAGPIEVSPVVYANVPFDPIADFEHVTRIGSVPYILVAHKDLGVGTLDELIALAKGRSEPLTYGSAGAGTINYLATELLKDRADIDLLHIPYQGAGPQMIDMLAGRLDVSMLVPNAITQHVADGTLVPLATSGTERSEAYPDVPTFTELGYDVEVSSWYGISAPEGTSPEIIALLDARTQEIAADPAFIAKLAGLGIEIDVSANPSEFEADIAEQLDLWTEVVALAGMEKIN